MSTQKDNSEFLIQLTQKVLSGLSNNFRDNWDEIVKGKEPIAKVGKGIRAKIKSYLMRKGIIPLSNEDLIKVRRAYDDIVGKEGSGLANLYSILSDEYSKDFLVEIIAFRILGYKHIKLRTNNQGYWENRKKADSLDYQHVNFESGLRNKTLSEYNLRNIQYPISLISYPPAITHAFMENHYEYHNEGISIDVNPGDTVIDAGGAWGDTALLFSYKAGEIGKVISFEFDPKNLKIFERNLQLNPDIAKNIVVEQKAIWNKSNLKLTFDSMGPSTKVAENSSPKQNGLSVMTTTIDDLSLKYGKIDFIKMDIEGAEPQALEGSMKTIRKFKPKIAISLYHNLSDFSFVADFIIKSGVPYECYISHPTIFENETVLVATPKKN